MLTVRRQTIKLRLFSGMGLIVKQQFANSLPTKFARSPILEKILTDGN